MMRIDKINSMIEDLVCLMDLDTLVAWAEKLRLDYDPPEMWFDDTWSDQRENLLVMVINAMIDVGKKKVKKVKK